MRWKLFLRRLSISAPRMTVRTHRPWPLRALRSVLLIGAGGAMALALYDLGREYGPLPRRTTSAETQALQVALAAAQAERDQLRAESLSAESKVAIEHAAQQQLASQVMQLEKENARLKEDLAFFESLPTMHKTQGVLIRSAKLTTDPAAQRLQYKLLVMQGGKPSAEFKGSVQLQITLQQGGRHAVVTVPEKGASDASFRLSFRHYQRIEGAWPIPAGAVVKSVDIRVVDSTAVRAQQSVNL
jgi:hypothetical protein